MLWLLPLLFVAAPRATAAPGAQAVAAQAAVQAGYEALDAGRPHDACAQFERAAREAPDWWIPYFERARCGRIVGDHLDDVLGALDAALRLEPHRGVLLHERGQVLEDAGRVEEAAGAYAEALRAAPRLHDARLGLARVDLGAGRFDAAQRGFALLLDGQPNLLEARAGLAESLLGLGDVAGAEQQFVVLCSASLAPATWLARLVDLYRRTGRPAAATLAYDAWREALTGRRGTCPVRPSLPPVGSAAPSVAP